MIKLFRLFVGWPDVRHTVRQFNVMSDIKQTSKDYNFIRFIRSFFPA